MVEEYLDVRRSACSKERRVCSDEYLELLPFLCFIASNKFALRPLPFITAAN